MKLMKSNNQELYILVKFLILVWNILPIQLKNCPTSQPLKSSYVEPKPVCEPTCPLVTSKPGKYEHKPPKMRFLRKESNFGKIVYAVPTPTLYTEQTADL